MKEIVRLFHGEELLVSHVALALRVEAKLPLILHDVAVLLGVKLEVFVIGEQLSPRLLSHLTSEELSVGLSLLLLGKLLDGLHPVHVVDSVVELRLFSLSHLLHMVDV